MVASGIRNLFGFKHNNVGHQHENDDREEINDISEIDHPSPDRIKMSGKTELLITSVSQTGNTAFSISDITPQPKRTKIRQMLTLMIKLMT